MTVPDPEALAASDRLATALCDPPTAWKFAPPGGRPWPQSLAYGAAGIALLHIERARAGRGDWDTVHTWLAAATSGELTAAPNAGLFIGVPALAFVLHAASGSWGKYRRALATLDEATVKITRTRLAAAHARIDRGELPELKEFDLIRGLAGQGAFHFSRHPDHPITGEVLSYLVRLTEPLPTGGSLPPWWTDVSPNGEPSPDCPSGHGNFGLSHGIGAVLALLSLSVLRDLPVAGAAEAIGRICSWTDEWRQHGAGPWWPGYITMDQVRRRRVEPSLRPRPSWCYGIGGTARAQQLAGMALGDRARQQVAEDAMLATLRDAGELDRIPEIGLCHGTAGLLHAGWRMVSDAPNSRISAELPRLTARLNALMPQRVTNPDLLDGVAGAALALHTIGTGTGPASGWDTVLLMS